MHHVRALHMVPLADLDQLLRFELARHIREPDEMEVIARELAANQTFERDSDLLGGMPEVIEQHAPAHVEHYDGGRPRDQLGTIHLEVVAIQAGGRTWPVAIDAIHQRLLEVEMEGIAEGV